MPLRPMERKQVNRKVNTELWRIKFRAYRYGQSMVKQKEQAIHKGPIQGELFA